MAISDLIGSSETFRTLLDKVAMVAKVGSAVLIQGETGTGKEVIARAIHDGSARQKSRFVAINCAAIPSALLESELFGHERGAFTGAIAQTHGRFQTADHGTLFLDEIGDLPLDLQPKLLRVLQEKQIERLGSGHPLRVDVRVIAATNQNLQTMMEERSFRADLFYRLNVFPIVLPPLRYRLEDIRPLANHFVQTYAAQQGKVIEHIPDEAMTELEQYDWPGNIRELQNVIERGVILTTGSVLSRLTTKDLKARPANAAPTRLPVAPKARTLADAERPHIVGILHETNGVIGGPRGAATQLGVPRTTPIAKMARLGITNELPVTRTTRKIGAALRIVGSSTPQSCTVVAPEQFMGAVAG